MGARIERNTQLLRDDEDGCPKDDGPRLAASLRTLELSFPAAVVLAFREYESLFLPCVQEMAGKPLPHIPKVPVVRLPFVEATAPEAIVLSLSEELDAHVGALLPG